MQHAQTAVTADRFADAYCGSALGPAETLGHWNFDPMLIGALLAAAIWHGVRRDGNRRIDVRAVAAIAVTALLYISPLCSAGSSLFLVRVFHHLALALILAPLVASLAARTLRRVPGGLVAWTILASVSMWLWHAPPAYDWAAGDPMAYWLMQGTILGSATLYWDRLTRASKPLAIVALLAAMVAMGALGALITLAPSALYAAHHASTAAWGLSPIEDQQIAGLIMWAPASAVYLAAALVVVHRLMGDLSRRTVAGAAA